MSAALSVGRVGGLAVALGVGAAILYGSAVAAAEVTSEEAATRPAAASTASAGPVSVSRTSGRSATAPVVGSSGPERAAAVSGVRAAPGNRGLSSGRSGDRASTGLPTADIATATGVTGVGVASPGPVDVAAPAAGSALAVPTPAVAASAAGAPDRAEAVSSVPPAAGAGSTADVSASVGPDPLATVSTPYGDLGKWMLRDGKVANWIDLPLCDDTGDCKTLQEPINVVFVVQASSKWGAQLQLDHSLRKAKFGPSPFSSIGYSGIVDGVLSGQMPHGGIFGFGLIPPLPFDLGSGPGLIPLLSPLGLGAAYRDAPFWEANAHLRTFGGTTDGDGNYIFTASVSDEYLIPTGGLFPTHAYESFVDARAALAANMVATGATELGIIDMQNEISSLDPDFTTGDHDGDAVVIGIAPRSVAPNPVRRKERGAAVRNATSV